MKKGTRNIIIALVVAASAIALVLGNTSLKSDNAKGSNSGAGKNVANLPHVLFFHASW